MIDAAPAAAARARPLAKIPDDVRFSKVLRCWPGSAVCCIGGGPSLTEAQVELVREAGFPTIAVNDAYLRAPFADVCYFSDFEWWGWHNAGIERPGFTADQVRERFATFAGQKCSISNAGDGIKDPAVHILKNVGEFGLSLRPDAVKNGRHSGFAALNLACLAGAAVVILIGYDARAPNGKSHWFGEHPRLSPPTVYAVMLESFSKAEHDLRAAGVRVINASPGSAIYSFEQLDLAAALDYCRTKTAAPTCQPLIA